MGELVSRVQGRQVRQAKEREKWNTDSKPLIKEGLEKRVLDISREFFTCFCSNMIHTRLNQRVRGPWME